ncbi:MAG: acyltransferase [Clostridia bacterium]|nr:acyltransferase [Clostridia bacterium]
MAIGTGGFIISNFAEIIFSIPKTLWFNFKVLPIKKAIKLPCVVSYHIKIKGVNKKNFIFLQENPASFSVRIGFGSSLGARRQSKKGLVSIENGGKIVLCGKTGFSQGVILATNGAEIKFGENFRCNYSSTIDATNDNITFGENVVIGWNVTVRNGDGHKIIENGAQKPTSAPIKIGNHVWLCAESTVLKGVNLGDDSVLGYGALLTKANGEKNTLFAGFPAKPIKTDINWQE